MNRNRILKSPPGAVDVYGADFVLKERTSECIKKVFSSFGYSGIQTPAFEYMEVFSGGMSISSSETIKFIDRGGSVMALRPDMTTSIYRAAASHLSDSPLPLRLWYEGSVFRSGENYKSAKKAEFTQAGAELLGAGTPEADAEIIAMTIKALLKTGLREFQIELAHAGFLQGIIDECALSEEDESTLKSLLDKKFSFGVEEFCLSHNIGGKAGEILSSLPTAFGDDEEIISAYRSESLNETSAKALSELEQVCRILKSCGFDKYITVDLGQVRSFNYYTGVIFRGLTQGSAFPICGGGRYDNLGRRFNLRLPATGVAIWVDRLADALLRSGLAENISPAPDILLISSPENRAAAFQKAEELRASGSKVLLDVQNLSEADALKSAEERGIKKVYSFDKEAFI